MANKSIVFTLSDGTGTITKSEDDILYMFQEVGGNYLLSVDEGKDREVHYIVDEDIATLEAAATKFFSITIADGAVAMSINADKVHATESITSNRTDIGVTGAQTDVLEQPGILEDSNRIAPNDRFTSVGVQVGDVLVNTTKDESFVITSVGTIVLNFEPSTPVFNISNGYKILRSLEGNTKIHYRGLGVTFDLLKTFESVDYVKSTINAL